MNTQIPMSRLQQALEWALIQKLDDSEGGEKIV